MTRQAGMRVEVHMLNKAGSELVIPRSIAQMRWMFVRMQPSPEYTYHIISITLSVHTFVFTHVVRPTTQPDQHRHHEHPHPPRIRARPSFRQHRRDEHFGLIRFPEQRCSSR